MVYIFGWGISQVGTGMGRSFPGGNSPGGSFPGGI